MNEDENKETGPKSTLKCAKNEDLLHRRQTYLYLQHNKSQMLLDHRSAYRKGGDTGMVSTFLASYSNQNFFFIYKKWVSTKSITQPYTDS